MENMILGVDIGGTKCAVIAGRVYSGSIDNTTGNASSNSNTGNTASDAIGKTAGAARGNAVNDAPCKINSAFNVEIIDKRVFPTETRRGPGHAINRIMEDLSLMMQKYETGTRKFKAIGISCGGPLDSKKGIIMSPPNLYGWDNIEITDMIEKRLGIKARLQNDANACALAEWRFGASRGYENVIVLTFGTGMGAGLIINGQLYEGANGMAGEVGHVRLEKHGPVGYGKAGSFEGFCSGGGIAQLARVRTLEALQAGKSVSFCKGIEELGSLDAKIIADAAKQGDELAIEIYKECGRYLGMGLSILIDILNPEIIVIGSIFSRSRDLLWPWAQEVIKRESLALSREVCKIVSALLGDKIGDYASLAVALG